MTTTIKLKRLMLTRRNEVVGYLREIARTIEVGEQEADAVIVTLSEGDVHKVFWVGYNDWDILGAACQAAGDERWTRKTGGASTEGSAEEKAERRRALREHFKREEEKRLAAEPFACKCAARFKTERGLAQHLAIRRHRPRSWEGPERHGAAPPLVVATIRALASGAPA